MITVNGPGGVVVNFPDGTDAGTIDQVMRENFKPEPEVSLSGMAAQLGVGVGEGAIGIAGLPADAADLASRGIDYATGFKTNETVGPAVAPFGSQGIQKFVEGYTGEFRKPQNRAEQIAGTVGRFVPAAMTGPGGIAKKLAFGAVAPALASEGAGYLAEGTPYEGAARVGGAIVGGVLGRKAANMLQSTKQAPTVTREMAEAEKTALYNSPAVKDVRLSPKIVAGIADKIKGKLDRQYIDSDASYKLLERMKTPQSGPNFSVLDLENIRRRFNDIAAKGGADAAAAKIATGYIEKVVPGLNRIPGAVVAGDAKAAMADLKQARSTARQLFALDKVLSAEDKALLSNAAAHSGANEVNALRQKIASILKSDSQSRGLSAEVKEAMRSFVKGSPLENFTRRLGKILGGGGGLGQMLTAGVGGSAFGWPGAVALPATGVAANRASTAMARSKFRDVEQAILNQTPLAKRLASQPQTMQQLQGGNTAISAALLRAIVNAQNARVPQ